MIEKPKRPKKIPNQDNKQPQSIQELIRRYDLDNTKIYDYLDALILQINNQYKQALENIYPIGSIYMSVNSVNPSTWLGGEWVTWGCGRVPVGVDTNDIDFATVEKTGGEKTHKLTIEEMPSHNHPATGTKDLYLMNDPTNKYSYAGVEGTSSQGVPWSATVATQGGGEVHNNLQPYITCYMWKRIS